MCVSGFVLILTEGLLTAAVYDGLSCRLSPLSHLCLLCSDIQTSTVSRNRDFLCLSLPGVLRGHTHTHTHRDTVSDGIKVVPHSCLHVLPVD